MTIENFLAAKPIISKLEDWKRYRQAIIDHGIERINPRGGGPIFVSIDSLDRQKMLIIQDVLIEAIEDKIFELEEEIKAL